MCEKEQVIFQGEMLWGTRASVLRIEIFSLQRYRINFLKVNSQCTSPENPVSCIKTGLEIYFTYGNIHVSMLFSKIIPPSPPPTESKLCSLHLCLLLSCTGMTLRDRMGREVGGRFRMGNTCTPMADSCQCMEKTIQYFKVISLQLK